MRLRTKFILFVGMLVVFISVSISGAVFVIESRNFGRNLDRTQADQASNFAVVCQQALTTSDMLFLINYIKALKNLPGIEWAFISDNADKILVHSDEKFIYRPLSEWKSRPAAAAAIEVEQPVTIRGQVQGRVHIGFSPLYRQSVIAAAVADTQRWVLNVAALGILLGLGGTLILVAFMLRPIRDLASGAKQISEGRLDVAIAVRSGDELGDLTRQFNQMAKRLKELDELKDEFISLVSHDLRGPLASIKMYVDYLLSGLRGGLNAEQQDMLKICAGAAGHLGIFINTILDSAKIKAGRMEYEMAAFPLLEALGPVVSLMKITAAQKSVTLELPSSAPPPLFGDRGAVEQVLANLLSNAVKHTPAQGRIQVSWQWDPPGRAVRVTVANTGPGIPAAELPNLFSRFYQADLKQQKALRIKGTGLGLSLVKKTVEAHGGRVGVESQANGWTRFYFTLPAAEEAASSSPARTAVARTTP